ncbi:hypothetical protein CDL15_Pgr005776 [Punica granatum]|uniref:Peptidase metallopeptidase domain-containing protein n=1 Tax=Punica granatum TaxID=22663 RepID=A0A218WGI3_PUNGR|nr:hypothetical protein CDL15_Pgr005776 [Punica granatum]
MKSTKIPSLNEVKGYLQAHGYMERPEDRPTGTSGDSLMIESSLKPAIRMYQEWNHLEVTGKLNSETIARMMTPRCGMPDIIRIPDKGVHHESKPGKFHVVAHYSFKNMNPWSQRQLTSNFMSIIPSVPIRDLRAICTRAFQHWAAVSPFRFREARQGEVANIKIGFYTRDHGDGYPIDGPGHTWAHAFAPRDGRLHCDGSENWSISTPTTYQTDLESVTLHEIGHTLGLNHSQDPDAVMYAYLNAGVTKRQLQQDDITRD